MLSLVDVDVDLDMDVEVDVEVEVDMDGFLKGASKSVQVLLNGMEAVMVLTLIVLKQRALFYGFWLPQSMWVSFR